MSEHVGVEVVESPKPDRPTLWMNVYRCDNKFYPGSNEFYLTAESAKEMAEIGDSPEITVVVPGTTELAARAAEDKRRAELWAKAIELAEHTISDDCTGIRPSMVAVSLARDIIAAERGEKKESGPC